MVLLPKHPPSPFVIAAARLGRQSTRASRAAASATQTPGGGCIPFNPPPPGIRPNEVLGRVPQGVLQETSEFFQCRSCEQIFWPGPKYSDTIDSLKAAVNQPGERAASGVGSSVGVSASGGGEVAAVKRLSSCKSAISEPSDA
ncbi:hypothetical protein T492DRAFT_845356 [Pavlovales sp. CCMP2436]|nr:hypothetical protein T492DRAFT_845356 [Pavlovales sp. CCMP2436]